MYDILIFVKYEFCDIVMHDEKTRNIQNLKNLNIMCYNKQEVFL